MLTLAASSPTSTTYSESEWGSEKALDSGLFASLFKQLSAGEGDVDGLTTWLENTPDGEQLLTELQSKESLNQLLGLLQQEQADGKPLPPDLNLEPEVLEKASAIVALLASYSDETSEAKPLIHSLSTSEGVDVHRDLNDVDVAFIGVLDQHQVLDLEKISTHEVIAANNEVLKESFGLHTVGGAEKSELKTEHEQPQESAKTLAKQVSTIGGVELKQAASALEVAAPKESKSPVEGVLNQDQTVEASAQVNLPETENLSSSERELLAKTPSIGKPSEILSYPAANHTLKQEPPMRERDDLTGEVKNKLTSNLSQVQSIGGQKISQESGDSEFEQSPEEDALSSPQEKIVLEKTSARLEPRFRSDERTLILSKPAHHQTDTHQLNLDQQKASASLEPLSVSSVPLDIDTSETEGEELLAQGKAERVALFNSTELKDAGKPQSIQALTSKVQTEALAQSTMARAQNAAQQQEQIELEVSQEIDVQSKSAQAAVIQESFGQERQERFNVMRRVLGGLASLNASAEASDSTHSTSTSNLHSMTQTQSSHSLSGAAEATNFAQQLAQSHERLQVLQEKLAPLVGQRLMMMMDQKVQQAEIQLDPPELGSLMVRVQVNQDNQAQVSFVAQNAQAKDALEGAIPRLKEMLQQQQMDLVQAEVSYQQREGRGNDHGHGASGQSEQAESNEELAPAIQTQAQTVMLEAGKVDFYA